MATIDKIKKDIEKNNARIKEIQKKAKEQVAEIQKKNKALEGQLMAEENMNIVKMVKTVNLDNKKLTAFLKAYAKGDITIPEEYLKEIEKMEDKKNAK